ncbi:hypothetical protein AB4Y43_16930 [Paraburkholderia sp. BR10872]|uniref:hypothetical protein n=1 Tax=Paraburkholderia sp. BR10872 TaxID=3236989 RepID=UPI0034D22E7F
MPFAFASPKSSPALFPNVKNAAIHDVLAELVESSQQPALESELNRLAATHAGADLLCEATIRIARALLLAKTVSPENETEFAELVSTELTVIREHHTLVRLAHALTACEAATEDDVFRDRRAIPDPLFSRRLELIRQLVGRVSVHH